MAKVILPRLNQTGVNEWSDVESNDLALREGVNAIEAEQLVKETITEEKLGKGSVGTERLASTLASFLGITAGGTTRRGFSEATSEKSTESTSWVELGGPSITITVPEKGLVSIMAEIECHNQNAGVSYVGLHEETDIPLSGSSLVTTSLIAEDASAFIKVWTRPAVSKNGVATDGARDRRLAGWVTFPATAGSRTYLLKYGTEGASSKATFKNRRLWAYVQGF